LEPPCNVLQADWHFKQPLREGQLGLPPVLEIIPSINFSVTTA
jgi:hypothetical protein